MPPLLCCEGRPACHNAVAKCASTLDLLTSAKGVSRGKVLDSILVRSILETK
ncbi:hypothetical protein CY34DRAFT_814469, partial [Suillus luteus UH-Slu-Lm8-n1]